MIQYYMKLKELTIKQNLHRLLVPVFKEILNQVNVSIYLIKF